MYCKFEDQIKDFRQLEEYFSDPPFFLPTKGDILELNEFGANFMLDGSYDEPDFNCNMDTYYLCKEGKIVKKYKS